MTVNSLPSAKIASEGVRSDGRGDRRDNECDDGRGTATRGKFRVFRPPKWPILRRVNRD